MESKWKSTLAVLAITAALACGMLPLASEPAGAVSTIVAATLNAATAAAPTQTSGQPAPAGTAVSFPGGGFVIPHGLASGASSETIAAVDEQGGAPWDVGPAYVKITLQGYSLQGTFLEPQIMVYPAAEYAAASQGAANSIQLLQAILANPSQMPETGLMPHLPYANAAQIIGAKPQVIAFNGGRGLRVLAEYAQYFATINNHDLFYHFEGLTDDGEYYIVATLPATAPFLAADSDPATVPPAGGVPFPGFDAVDEIAVETYYTAVTQLLNSTADDQFAPSLAALDALIGTLSVSP